MYEENELKMMDKIEELLDVYDLEELLADNDLSVAEVIYILWQDGHIDLPKTRPV
jgi:hypothetical protein